MWDILFVLSNSGVPNVKDERERQRKEKREGKRNEEDEKEILQIAQKPLAEGGFLFQ